MMESLKFEEDLRHILEKDKRYHRDAYLFVFEALEYTLQKVGQRRHVSGRELCEGIRDFLHEHYGLLAFVLLERWGIKETIDFGEIVFNLVNNGLMRKTEEDRIDDFRDVYSLREELFDKYDFGARDADLSIHLKRELPYSED
jgi:uncharacterized repeat protein (TIGR04138 family)